MSCMPALDLWTKPKAGTAWPQVQYRAGHGRVAALVQTDRVALAQAEHSSDLVRVDEIVECYSSRHLGSLHPLADMSYTC